MSAKSERKKKRYAEDPVFRERELATNRRFRLRHREELNERKRLERISDPAFPARHHERTIRIKYGLPLGNMVGCWPPRTAFAKSVSEPATGGSASIIVT